MAAHTLVVGPPRPYPTLDTDPHNLSIGRSQLTSDRQVSDSHPSRHVVRRASRDLTFALTLGLLRPHKRPSAAHLLLVGLLAVVSLTRVFPASAVSTGVHVVNDTVRLVGAVSPLAAQTSVPPPRAGFEDAFGASVAVSQGGQRRDS